MEQEKKVCNCDKIKDENNKLKKENDQLKKEIAQLKSFIGGYL